MDLRLRRLGARVLRGLRACEIRGLQWKHVDWDSARIQIRRSKTPAGWRDPSLNAACACALKELHVRAKTVGFDHAEHYRSPGTAVTRGSTRRVQ